jgi:hypothetical protein
MPWTLLFTFLSGLPGAVGDYFKQKNEITKQKLENELKIEQAKQQMAMQVAQAQLELNKTIVSSTGAYFKYFTFLMWFGPFMAGMISPELSKAIFSNMSGMPEWYVQSCMVIMFTVWGISVSANAVSGIFSGISQFISDKREYKLEKARINRKDYFDEMRKIKGTISQEEVDEANRLLDGLGL